MKTQKWIDSSIEIFINEDSELWSEDGAFDDNWIVSAQDIFHSVASPENPFDHEFAVRQAA